MLLTIQDCEAAAQVIDGFLRGEPKRFPLTVEVRTRASVSRLRERAVTPSGKLLELYELRARNQASPHLVKLCFYPPAPPQRRMQKSMIQSASETVEYLASDGTTYRAPVLRRDKSGVQQRRQEEDVRFHVLLPGQRTPTTLDGQRTGRDGRSARPVGIGLPLLLLSSGTAAASVQRGRNRNRGSTPLRVR